MLHQTTQQYIAFLRAINVGGHTVKMDRLRALFEDLGVSEVATFIASGNVIFESENQDMLKLEEKIADHLRQSLGYDVATFLRTVPELAAVANFRPFSVDGSPEGSSLYIGFLHVPPAEEAIQKLLTLQTNTDRFHVPGRELYWLCHTRISDSKISSGLLEKTLGMKATLRNSTTVRKLAAKLATTDPRSGLPIAT